MPRTPTLLEEPLLSRTARKETPLHHETGAALPSQVPKQKSRNSHVSALARAMTGSSVAFSVTMVLHDEELSPSDADLEALTYVTHLFSLDMLTRTQ